MPAAAVVTILAAVIIIVVLAVFLLAIARVLADVNRQLGTVIGAVGEIAARTKPVEGVVVSINRNLAAAASTLTGLLDSKVGAQGAAELVASVDPLAANGGAPAASSGGGAINLKSEAAPARARLLPPTPESERATPRSGGGAINLKYEAAPAPAPEPPPPPPSEAPFSGGGAIHLKSEAAPEPAAASPSSAGGDERADSMAPAPPGVKICPDCAEEVRSEARICRFCRYPFEGGGSGRG